MFFVVKTLFTLTSIHNIQFISFYRRYIEKKKKKKKERNRNSMKGNRRFKAVQRFKQVRSHKYQVDK